MRARLAVPAGIALLLVVVAVVAVRTLGSGDGPAGDFGSGPEQAPERRWAVPIDASSDIALVSDGPRVYLVLQEPRGELGYDPPVVVTAYAADGGEELWSVDLTTDSSLHAVRALGDDEVLVTGSGGARTTALLDGRTGEVAWEVAGRPHEPGVSLGISIPAPAPDRSSVLLLARDDRIVAVDRDDGTDLWSTTADDALVCGDVVVTVGDRLAGRDARTGEERWATTGDLGGCDDEVVAVGRPGSDLGVDLVAVGSGETVASHPVAGRGTAFGVPTPDHVVISWYDLEGDAPATGVVVRLRTGGDPVYEAEDAVAVPVGDGLVLVAGHDGRKSRVVRLADGEELGLASLGGRQGSCAGVLTRRTAVVCDDGAPDVTAFALDEVGTRWTVTVGAPVVEATVGGDRLFVVTGDQRLVAYR